MSCNCNCDSIVNVAASNATWDVDAANATAGGGGTKGAGGGGGKKSVCTPIETHAAVLVLANDGRPGVVTGKKYRELLPGNRAPTDDDGRVVRAL